MSSQSSKESGPELAWRQPVQTSRWWIVALRRVIIVGLLAALLSVFVPRDATISNSTAYVHTTSSGYPDLYEASIADLQKGLEAGHFTSVDLVKAYLARIDEVNLKGPALRAVIETNPSALSQAAVLDLERRLKGPRGPLHGIPILLKDNIATLHSEGMNTTAGSYALLGSVVPRDATVAAKLRAAGAILLGKANLSEWANWRGTVPSGFSGRGGQCTSAYVPLGGPSGSSSGSGVATAIGLAAASLGSETDGSIILPCSTSNLVGIKPTVGLTSRADVIPISSHQDSVGPMTRSVADAALLLSIIAGKDSLDNYTSAQPSTVPDYTKALNTYALHGARLGVVRQFMEHSDEAMKAALNATLGVMRSLGATVIDPVTYPAYGDMTKNNTEMLVPTEMLVLRTDFKVDVNSYIAGLLEVPTGVKDLAGLIAYNTAHPDEELVDPYWTDQSRFLESEDTSVNQSYFDALAVNKELGQTRGIDATLAEHNLDALLILTPDAPRPAALAGYPVITVPLGFLPDDVPLSPAQPTRAMGPNMPFGISFLGSAFSEFKLISLAYAYEQATHARLAQLAYPEAIPKTQLEDIVGRN